tara:strand:+ start:1120 stop:2091 length:972 start_codon:yes stop_codon:yes gene_type:complete
LKKPDEHETIKILLEKIGQPSHPSSKIGDDVSMLPTENGELIIATDMLVKETDVPKGMKSWQIARKSIVGCVSDFAAKGVQPKASLVSLGIPSSITRNDIGQLADGFKKATNEYKLEIIGGDTNETNGLIIDCCMVGFSEKIVRRNGAVPGDKLVVTGFFGYPPLGLKVLQESLNIPDKIKQKAISSILLPTPKLELALALTKISTFSSSIDSSDGLAISLHQLAEASRVGFEVSKMPADKNLIDIVDNVGIDIEDVIFYGGEEYEIIATIPEEKWEAAQRIALDMGTPLIEIGKVTDDSDQILFDDGNYEYNIDRRGWVHLS